MTLLHSTNVTSDDQIMIYKMGEACGRLGGDGKCRKIFFLIEKH